LALLLIDLVNPLCFDGGEALLERALPVVEKIARLKARARAAGVPAIYVNDNFDLWHLGFRELVTHFQEQKVLGMPVIERILPDLDSDHFILKPMHSGFFQTALDVLLERLDIHTVVLTGIAGDICVFFTANDAHMRGFRVVVPSDCVASETSESNTHALRQMQRVLKARICTSEELKLGSA